MNLNKEKYLKYLPSKTFSYVMLGFIVIGIIFLVMYFFFSSNITFLSSKKEGQLKTENLTVNELVQNDTDNDGVFDWEEALWGTDKNNKTSFDQTPDLEYIQKRKKDLKLEPTTNENDENLTETEKFAREFFSSFVAMKASGEVDANTINNFSTALGEKIVYPSLIDSYSLKNIQIDSNDTKENKMAYYLKLKKIFENYSSKGLGDELSEISNVLTLSGTLDTKNSKLTNIYKNYQDFAKKTSELSVPKSLVENHLQIINSANNTGISIMSMAKLSTDPIVGISGLSQYQKYSDELIKAVGDLELKLLE